jgi:hypothetical protein
MKTHEWCVLRDQLIGPPARQEDPILVIELTEATCTSIREGLLSCYLGGGRLPHRRPILDLHSIVSELKSERDRIARAIAALENESIAGGVPAGRVSAAAKSPGRGGGLTPAGRRRLSESMKRRWAARRRAGIGSTKTTASAAPKKKGGGLTAAGRKRLSEMMKKRWAEKKRQSS